MDGEEYRRNARQFHAVARQLGHLVDRVHKMGIAACWLERGGEADGCRELFSQR